MFCQKYTTASTRHEWSEESMEWFLDQQTGTLLLGFLVWSSLHGILLSPLVDHAHQIEKQFFHIRVCLCRRFNEPAAKLLCKSSTLFRGDLSLFFQIELVSHQLNWNLQKMWWAPVRWRESFLEGGVTPTSDSHIHLDYLPWCVKSGSEVCWRLQSWYSWWCCSQAQNLGQFSCTGLGEHCILPMMSSTRSKSVTSNMIPLNRRREGEGSVD